jgi:putative glutamine amidotransferase
MIKIGLSPCFMYEDPSRAVFGPKCLTYTENDMIEYLARKNIMPVFLMDLPEDHLEQIFDELDGILFSGGSDVCPKSYNQDFLDEKKWPGDPVRDAFDFKLMDKSLKRKLPIYGICRGAQIINAYLGGTLYQDIATSFPSSLPHRDPDKYDHVNHAIKFSTGGILEEIYKGVKNPRVNSVHHQSIETLAPKLVLEAISPEDNIVEGFSYKDMDEQFILAVQWHPEFSHSLGDKVISPEPLMDYFLKKVESLK